MAFLVAWSALIITITAKAVSANKDFELKVVKVEWGVENNRSMMETLGADQQQLRSRVSQAEEVLLAKLDALTQENEQLRKQLGMREPTDDHVKSSFLPMTRPLEICFADD